MEKQELKNSIIEFVNNDSETTLTLDSSDENLLVFATRENGDVGDEEVSSLDIADANSLEKRISEINNSGINVEFERSDDQDSIEYYIKISK